MSHHGRKVWLSRSVAVRADVHLKGVRALRANVYDEAVKLPLIKVWEVMDYPCGKRLAPVLPAVLANLEAHGHLQLDLR